MTLQSVPRCPKEPGQARAGKHVVCRQVSRKTVGVKARAVARHSRAPPGGRALCRLGETIVMPPRCAMLSCKKRQSRRQQARGRSSGRANGASREVEGPSPSASLELRAAKEKPISIFPSHPTPLVQPPHSGNATNFSGAPDATRAHASHAPPKPRQGSFLLVPVVSTHLPHTASTILPARVLETGTLRSRT